MTKKQLQSQINDLKKEISSLQGRSKERWQTLKDYLKVEEEEYAELVSSSKYGGYWFSHITMEVESTPVKKIRLIPIKKGKK